MAAKSKAKKSSAKLAPKKSAKPAAKAKRAPAKPRGEEVSSDLRKVALAHALRRLQ
jgi:hypothetical protein